MGTKYNWEGMRQHARGSWGAILGDFGGAHLITGKHQPCPFNDCEATKDGFRYTDFNGHGEWICSGHGAQHSGDGFDLLVELQGISSGAAYDLARQTIGEPYGFTASRGDGNGRAPAWNQPGPSFQADVREQLNDQARAESLRGAIITAGQFRQLEIEPPERVCGPIYTEGLTIFAGAGGVGKSWFGMGLATAIHTGRDFCHWKVDKARSVLHIDTELPPGLIHARTAALHPDISVLNRHTWATAGLGRFNLLDETHADFAVEEAAKRDLVVLDNAYSAAIPTDERKGGTAEFWLAVYEFFHRISLEGTGLILIDHLGRGGGIQGSINKEWAADLYIKLKTPENYVPISNQFHVELEVAKQRNGWEPEYMKDQQFSFINGRWSQI